MAAEVVLTAFLGLLGFMRSTWFENKAVAENLSKFQRVGLLVSLLCDEANGGLAAVHAPRGEAWIRVPRGRVVRRY
jgi:hypothetical protein